MKEISVKWNGKAYEPFSEEDFEESKDFKIGYGLRAKISGINDQRSLKQMALYWVLCTALAENIDNPNWNHKNKVDEQIKIALRFVDFWIVSEKTGAIAFKTHSIAVENLSHIKACNYFDRAFEEMAKVMTKALGYHVSVDDLLTMGNERT